LASGLPVITTRVPGAGDLIQEGVNGLLLADPSDAAALSKLIANALADDRLSEWSRNAAVSVKGLDWSAIVGQLHSVLQALA
jgi:glycosyltransferase involved in cell wall biosynthesis